MEQSGKGIKAAAYVAGVAAIAGAVLLAVLLILSVSGLIHPRATGIVLYTGNRSCIYDGAPVQVDAPVVSGGSLHEGHRLHIINMPCYSTVGEYVNAPRFEILDDTGAEVTHLYDITEDFGTLEILPIELIITTESAQKEYDGRALSAGGWSHVGGTLLDGHKLDMTVTASLSDVGRVPNEGKAWVLDGEGKDVTALYRMNYQFGTLEVKGIPLGISTASARKVYDGTPLTAPEWELTSGTLEPGAVLEVRSNTVFDGIGSVDNVLRFGVKDANGADVTHRYSIVCDYGTLNVQPRAISIRTGSAEKVYDGQPLSCHTFELIGGSLCQGEEIFLTCGSITEVGYADNYVLDCTIYRADENGGWTDVTACYRIAFDFGMLKITAP